MIDGKSVTAVTEFQQEAVRTFTDVMLCREFGWTPSDIAAMPADFYEAAVLILNKEGAKQKAAAERQKLSRNR